TAELVAIVLLVGAAFAAAGFIVAYSLLASTQWLGIALGVAFLLIAATLIVAGKKIAPRPETVEQRPKLRERAVEAQVGGDIEEAGEGISRRKALAGAGAAAGAALGGALVIPIASLGPKPGNVIGSSPWRRGTKLVNEDHQRISPDDVRIGTFIT